MGDFSKILDMVSGHFKTPPFRVVYEAFGILSRARKSREKGQSVELLWHEREAASATFDEHWKCRKPHSGNKSVFIDSHGHLDFALFNEPRPREQAIDYEYVQVNPKSVTSFIALDLDMESPDLHIKNYGVPQPTIMTVNPATEHGHALYALETPVVHGVGHERPSYFLNDVRQLMTKVLDADLAYSGYLTQNPHHDRWMVAHSPESVYSLQELKRHFSQAWNQKLRDGKSELDDDFAPLRFELDQLSSDQLGSRNVASFDRLRLAALQGFIRHQFDEQWLTDFIDSEVKMSLADTSETRTENQLIHPGLSDAEIRSMGRSVARWTRRNISQETFSYIQSCRRQKSLKRFEEIDSMLKNLADDGLSIDQIIQACGVSRSYVYRSMKNQKIETPKQKKMQELDHLINMGCTNDQIAEIMNKSVRQVRNARYYLSKHQKGE